MTVHTYRFRLTSLLDLASLKDVAGQTTALVAADGGFVVDYSQDDATDHAGGTDLKTELATKGFTFVELDPTDEPADAFTPKGGGSGGGGPSGIWKFNTSVGGGDPGSKKVAFNNAVYASVAFMYINDTADDPTFDFGTLFTTLNVGDQVAIQQNDDATRFVVYLITSIADSTGFWTFGLTHLADAGGAMIANNKATSVAFFYESNHIKHNLTATTDPGTGDDSDDGYEKLSHWINTTSGEAFICLDASVDAADWKSLTAGAGGSTPVTDFITTQAVTGTDTALTATLSQDPELASVVCVFNGLTKDRGATRTYTLGGTGNKTITWLASTGDAEDMDTNDQLQFIYLQA